MSIFLPSWSSVALELVYVGGSDAAILGAEQPQDGCIDFLQRVGVGGEMAVVDHRGGQGGFLQSDIERVASAHAPSDGADAVFLHVGLRREKFESGVKVAFGAVFGDSAHDFVRHVGSGRNFAAIEIDGERDVSLVGEFRSLVFHPIVQTPPFVDDDQRGERAFSCGRVENTLHGFVAAFVGDGLAVGGEGGGGEQNETASKRSFFMVSSSCAIASGHSGRSGCGLQLEFHVDGAGDGIRAVRSDFAESKFAVHRDGVFHDWLDGIEAHALITDLAGFGDDAVRQSSA